MSAAQNQVIVTSTLEGALIVVTNGDEHAYLGLDPDTATKPLSWGDLKDLAR